MTEHRPDGWLSAKSAAAYCDVNVQTIYDWTYQGILPRSAPKGYAQRYRREDLDRAVAKFANGL
jgi:predicted site-specific integrase-resolvase